MRDAMWITANGRKLLVSQMEDSHLHSCVAKILCSRSGWRRCYLEQLQLELLERSVRRMKNEC